MDADFFAGFNKDLHDPARWEAFYKSQQAKDPNLPAEIPPDPKLDGEWLFFDIMAGSQAPDPWMFPALKNLKASGRYIIAALSNTVIFPPDHEYSQGDYLKDTPSARYSMWLFHPPMSGFGNRTQRSLIYQHTLEKVNAYARSNAHTERGKAGGWANGIKADDILFLDDIGENLKAAKKAGFRTLRVHLGRAFEALDEQEAITGLKLAGDHLRIPVQPKMSKNRANI